LGSRGGVNARGEPNLSSVEEEGVWVVECVDRPRHFSDMTDRSLRFDTSGNPHVVYWDSHGYHLGYAYWDGSAWQLENVDSQCAT
jgi:hypothetical protein